MAVYSTVQGKGAYLSNRSACDTLLLVVKANALKGNKVTSLVVLCLVDSPVGALSDLLLFCVSVQRVEWVQNVVTLVFQEKN